MARYLLVSLYLISLVVYGLAGPRVFIRTRALTNRLRAGSAVATAIAAVQIYSLLKHVATSYAMIGAAVAAYIGALALFAWASRATRTHRLPVAFDPASPERIWMEGPYRYVRHPFYVSYSLTFLAGALSTSWWPAWLVAGLMWMGYFRTALAEEKHLLAVRAEEYRGYRRRTGAFVPRIVARTL